MSQNGHTITEADVRHVARLSRLRLTDEQVRHFAQQLTAVLGHVEQLNGLDVQGVEPLVHAGGFTNVLRPDVPRADFTAADLLASAPQRDGDFFAVPKVIGDDGGGA